MVFFSKNLSVEDAYNVVQGPLMALIGGTLAVAKDLIHPGSSESSENDVQKNGENKQPGE